MSVLFTTSNFPDVMLPAYHSSTFNVIFFIMYLVFGLYFLLNTLLATIFTNYKNRLQAKVEMKEENRKVYLEYYFNVWDKEKKGCLDLESVKGFFRQVLDLNYCRKEDQQVLRKILQIIDPAKTKVF